MDSPLQASQAGPWVSLKFRLAAAAGVRHAKESGMCAPFCLPRDASYQGILLQRGQVSLGGGGSSQLGCGTSWGGGGLSGNAGWTAQPCRCEERQMFWEMGDKGLQKIVFWGSVASTFWLRDPNPAWFALFCWVFECPLGTPGNWQPQCLG